MAGEYFQQLIGSQAPLASGFNVPMTTGFEGVPGFGGGGLTSLGMQMFAAPALTGMMRGIGMTPMGMMHDQNVYDVYQNRRFTAAYQQTMQEMAASERANYMRTMQGMAAMAGVPFGARQRQAAGSLADMAVAGAPIMAQMFPDLLDDLGGARGSAVVMSQRIAQGSRYRLDPSSGQLGFSDRAVTSLSRSLYGGMFEGPDLAGNAGFSAGQMGGLYDELARRGMISGPSGSLLSRTRTAAADVAAIDPVGLSRIGMNVGVTVPTAISAMGGADLDKLRLDPAVADKMRSFDAEAVKKSLRAYTGAIAAVRDIFGDMGMGNAPMSQLVAGLEVLTSNQASQFSPDRLATIVRQTHALSQATGVSIDTAMLMQQHAVGRAEQLGLNPIFGIMANQGAMAWGGAYRGAGGGSQTAWGKPSPEQSQQADANLRVQAAGSQMANQMNLVLRISDTFGGFAAGSKAEAYDQAVREGRTEFIDPSTGQVRSTVMTEGEHRAMIASAKGVDGKSTLVPANRIEALLNQKHVNMEYGAKYNIPDLVRRSQGPVELVPYLASATSGVLGARFRALGMSPAEADAAARRDPVLLTQKYMDMAPEDFTDRARRDAAGAEILRKYYGPEMDSKILASGQSLDSFYRGAASDIYGQGDDMLRESPKYSSLGGMQGSHPLINQSVHRAAARIAANTAFEGRMRAQLAPFARGSFVRRAVTAIQNANINDPNALKKVIAESLGGVSDNALRDKLGNAATGIHAQIDKVKALHQKVQEAPEGPLKKQLLGQLRAEEQALTDAVGKATEMDADAGIDRGPSAAEAAAAVHGMARLDTLDGTMATLRAGSGDPGKDKAAWGKFWGSESGATYRDAVSTALGDATALSSAAIGSKEAMRRFGPQALEKHKAITTAMSRLKDLALYNSSGSLERLMAGDLNVSGADATAVNAEVKILRAGIAGNANFFTGRGWVGDPRALARQMLGPGAKEEEIARAAADIETGQHMAPGDGIKADRLNVATARLAGAKPGTPEYDALKKARDIAVNDLSDGWGEKEAAKKLQVFATMGRADEAARAVRDLEGKPTSEALASVYKAFGLNSDKAGAEKDAAGMVGVDPERLARLRDSTGFLRSMIATHDGADLTPEQERRAIRRLSSAYGEATDAGLPAAERAKKIAQLRTDYSLGSDDDFKSFEDNFRFLKASGGIDAATAGDENERRDKLKGVIRNLSTGEYRASASGGTGDNRIEIAGTLKIDWDKGTGDIRASAPDMHHAAPA